MQRRDFLKISAAGGAAAALEGCGNPDHQLIRFIPEEDLIPGLATWKPSICTLCPAGCGTIVRVMQGEAEVVRNGQLGILKMGLAKKIEGNPAHPISQGKLCPRGHAALQVTYHPDRIKTPLQRTGPRGSGQFKEITWDEAIKQLVSQLSPLYSDKQQSGLVFLTSLLRGQRAKIVASFAEAFKYSHRFVFAFFDDAGVRAANATSFNQPSIPTVDLAQANYVLSFGADFLGTWNSPVAQSIGYGTMRKGRPGQRGKFVHVEARLSQTAANADEWIPCRPGSEGLFALSLANVILHERLRPSVAVATIDGWSQGLPDYAPEKTADETGVPAGTLTRIARELAANTPAVVLIGGAAVAHTNGTFNGLAVNALNILLGSINRTGGLQFPDPWKAPQAPVPPPPRPFPTNVEVKVGYAAEEIWPSLGFRAIDALSTRLLFLYGTNPVYAATPGLRVREELEKIPFIASFDSFINETSAYADLILPDHSPLESWLDDLPAGGGRAIASLAAPAMSPLHNTRSMPDVLLDVAQQLGGDLAKSLPWKTYDEALKASFTEIYKTQASKDAKNADEFWRKVQDQGGWWSADVKLATLSTPKFPGPPRKKTVPEFDGDPSRFPFHLLPYASQLWYDGSLAHLPWMQEAPDPISSVMWGTWIEINTQTAAKLGIEQGDLIEVASQHGTLQAPAFPVPGIAPDCVAMPVGQGHTNFTRYASNRGANPISILAPLTDVQAGSPAWAATRVKITRIGKGKMVLFGASMSEESPETKHR